MNKRLLYLIFSLSLLLMPLRFAEAGLIRNAFHSCAFGAGAMAAATYLGLAPELSTGVLAIPVADIMVSNAVVGCVVGAAGATAMTVTGWFFDAIF
jgi:hypothetical protein